MSNPFEDSSSNYFVLANSERQHSLWPAAVDIPEGWSVQHGPTAHSECLAFVEANWVDMRPASLATFMTDNQA